MIPQMLKIFSLLVLVALTGCASKPYRYCFAGTAEEDGGYVYEFDGGYVYEFDGGYVYEFDGGYVYEFDSLKEIDADRGSNKHPVICRAGVECSPEEHTKCMPPSN